MLLVVMLLVLLLVVLVVDAAGARSKVFPARHGRVGRVVNARPLQPTSACRQDIGRCGRIGRRAAASA
eukprot:10625481-Heterocapsa_arctica.AAC.1